MTQRRLTAAAMALTVVLAAGTGGAARASDGEPVDQDPQTRDASGTTTYGTWQQIGSAGSKQLGDCTLGASVQQRQVTHTSADGTVVTPSVQARARGRVVCTRRHSSTVLNVRLKRGGVVMPGSIEGATWTNSFGTGETWRSTAPADCPGAYVQGVTSATISGLGSGYVTTGAPVRCSISSSISSPPS